MPSCNICVRYAQECRYPSCALKPGPKLGKWRVLHRSCTARICLSRSLPGSIRRRPSDAVSRSTPSKRDHSRSPRRTHARREDISEVSADDGSINPSTINLNDIPNWIFHHFHDIQTYRTNSNDTSNVIAGSDMCRSTTLPSDGQRGNIDYFCYFLELSREQISLL